MPTSSKKSGLLGLILLAFLLILTAGWTIGLTYAPCYASLCSEAHFPTETRLHIASYYALLASTGLLLVLRAYIPFWRSVSETYLTTKPIPLFGHRITVGGLLLSLWLLGITLATTPIWLQSEVNYWTSKTDPFHWLQAKVYLVVTGIIGHHIDYILGLVLIPVGRNSILGRVFVLHQGTLLYAHKLLAYLLLIGVLAHGIAYYIFVGTYGALKDTDPIKNAFNIDNPFYSEAEILDGGYWHAATLASGTLSLILIIVITITALPVLRRNAYNTFYYIHVIFGSLVFILASIHCSTDFYFLLPGLILWAADWAWRLFRGDTGLAKTVTGKLEAAEGGWCRITLPPGSQSIVPEQTNDGEKRGHLLHPLQTYYLTIPSVSKLQNHAFTAAKVGSHGSGPMILFQRTQLGMGKRKQKKLDKEWTWKALAAARSTDNTHNDVDVQATGQDVKIRVEGPYSPSEVTAFETSDLVVCVVGGTGLTGAYSLAEWWLQARSRESHGKFVMIWTVRHRETADLAEWKDLVARVNGINTNMELVLHITSEQGRLDVRSVLKQRVDAFNTQINGKDEETLPSAKAGRSAWVYVSGPAGLLDTAENACIDLERETKSFRKATKKSSDPSPLMPTIEQIDRYISKWEV